MKFFYVFYPMTNKKLFDDVDVGCHRPLGSSTIQRRGERVEVAGLAVVDYEAIEKNLEGLTVDIPDASIDEIPRHYQCQTVGVSTSIG
jgi:hypothetical protein